MMTDVSHQLIKRKSNLIYFPVKIPIECTVALLQQVDTVEQCSDPLSKNDDVIIATSNM